MILVLEINPDRLPREPIYEGPPDPKSGRKGGVLLVCPEVGPDYWLYRVKVSETQAVLGFPKFLTIGIGFAEEEDDWNTNLPYKCSTKSIFNHIKCNKGDSSIPDQRVMLAIRMIQEQAVRDRPDGGAIGDLGDD